MKDLLLVIEVLGPSTLRYDRFTKRRPYQERRIPSYWAVDGEERWVEVWTPAADRLGPSPAADMARYQIWRGLY